MARGITETDVHTAADALVAAGERPTVERIRAHLGTGSPNTIGPLFDRWWVSLGARLQRQQAKLALPDAPPDVAALATQLWEQALESARQHTDTAVAAERAQLEADRCAVAAERLQLQAEFDARAAAAEAARQAQGIAEARLADAHRLIEQQAAQLADLAMQRTASAERVERLESDNATLQASAAEQATAMAAERQRHGEHIRAVEDRAHAEVDRTRQEIKELRRSVDAAQRERQQLETQGRQREDALREAVVQAQREASTERVRADTLAAQLDRQSISLAVRGAKVVRVRKTPRGR